MGNFSSRAKQKISLIPKGKVATYGQIAALCGSPRSARMIGQILARSAADLPWQRVINSAGRISIVNFSYPASMQAKLLDQEGIEVKQKGSEYFVDLGKYLWQP